MKINYLLTGILFVTCLAISCKKDEKFQQLKAEFEVDKTSIKVGEEIVFTDKSTGDVSTWDWIFEGASPDSSILSSPVVTYNQPGTYSVTLRIGNAAHSASITKEALITVGYSEVKAGFYADPLIVIPGEEIQFHDTSGGYVETWAWEFSSPTGTTITSTQQHPVVKFTEMGVYDVKLKVSNAEFSNETIMQAYVSVVEMTADFEAGISGTYEGGTVAFTDKSIGRPTTWAWEFEGGTPATSTEQNPTITYSTAGRYKVKLTASNSTMSKELIKEGYIVVMPGNSLAAYFPFGGSLNDAGPNRLISDITGTITVAGSNRKNAANDAAVFNGSGYLMIADHSAFDFNTDDYSIACWLKTDRTNRQMIWMESGSQGSRDNQTWMRLGANTTTQLLGFATEDANGGSFLGLSAAEGGNVMDNAWHHVVCVRQGLKTMVYVDGVKVKEVSSASGIKDVSNTSGFKIGAQQGASGFSNYYNGLLDDLVIYNKALSQAEITQLYNL